MGLDLTDEEPEIGEIKLKEPKFTWFSVQWSWNVSAGLSEYKVRGVRTQGVFALWQ